MFCSDSCPFHTYFCNTCGSEMYLLGQLGDLYWFRCRACGDEAGLREEAMARMEALERETDEES